MSPATQRPPEQQSGARDAATRAVLMAGGLAAAMFLLWRTRDVLVLLFAGLLFGICLATVAGWLHERARVPRAVGLASFIVLLLALLCLAVVLAGPELSRQISELQTRLPEGLEHLQGRMESTTLGRNVLGHIPSVEEIMPKRGSVIEGATGIASATFGALASTFVFFLFGLFVAAQPEAYLDGLLRLAAPHRRARLRAVLTEAVDAIRRWIMSKVIRMIFIGLATWIALRLLGVPVAGLLGSIAALLAFVPNFGPIVAAIPAVLLAFTQGIDTALWVAGLYVAIQFVEGNVLDPILTKTIVALPPGLTLGTQLVLGVLAGPVGLAVATPLVAGGVVIVRRLYVEDRLEGGAGVSH